MPQNYINRLLGKGIPSISNLVKNTNCNKKTPQYHNLLITNIKENYIHVFNGKSWELANKNDTLDYLIANRTDYIVGQYFELKEIGENTAQMDRKIVQLENAYEDNDEVLMRKIKRELEILLYNHRETIKKTKMKQEELLDKH